MSELRHVVDVAQGTPEWLQARCGLATGSKASAIVATIRKGEATTRRDYRMELVCERLTGHPATNGFVSRDMQRGTDLEPEARAAYETFTGNLVDRVGFVKLDTTLAGCSPDGWVAGELGILELKCPKSSTHLGYLQKNELPAAYIAQVTHNVWVTEAKFCDFVSFDPRFPPELQLFMVRVQRGELKIDEYRQAVEAFLEDVRTTEAEARKLMEKPRVA